MILARPHRLLRSVRLPLNPDALLGAGDCVIIPQENQPATGPFTLEFDTGDVLEDVIPGDSFYFAPDSYESCRISSANSADTQINVQAGFGRKFMLGQPGIPPAPPIVSQNAFGIRLDAQYDLNLAANTAANFGGWTLSKTKRIWLSLAPGTPGAVWVQSSASHGTFPLGLPLYPGNPIPMEASDPAGGGQGLFYIYNPNSIAVLIYALVEYYT